VLADGGWAVLVQFDVVLFDGFQRLDKVLKALPDASHAIVRLVCKVFNSYVGERLYEICNQKLRRSMISSLVSSRKSWVCEGSSQRFFPAARWSGFTFVPP
jgi:hypothetical protein